MAVSATLLGGWNEEADVDRVHVETADHLECNGEEQDAVAGCRQ